MATTITHSTGTISPTSVEGFEAESEANTIVHRVLNRSNPDATLRAFDLRTGELTLTFDAEEPALSAFAALRVPQVLSITNAEVAAVAMTFVVGPAGERISIAQDRAVTSVWRIRLPFVEVSL